MTLYLPLEGVGLVLVILSSLLIADVLTRNRVPYSWRAVVSIVLAMAGLMVAGYTVAHAAPPDADYSSGGYLYDQALFIEEGQRAVVMAGGAVITPVAFADSLNAYIMGESTNNPKARNAQGCIGLLQLCPDAAMYRHVKSLGYEWGDMEDPFINLWVGYGWWVKTGSTWSHWEFVP